MKELKENFIGKGEVKGFEFTQKKNNNYGYIYEVRCYNKVWYEVFIRKYNKQFDCISYPTSKGFGLWAWNAKSMIDAGYKLKEIEIRKQSNI